MCLLWVYDMRKLVSVLLVCSCIGFAAWVWQARSTACERTRRYRIGEVDSRFGLTMRSFHEVVQDAERIWEAASGQDLFTYDPHATLTINLVFDQRQQATIDGQKLSRKLKKTEASHERLTTLHQTWQTLYEERAQSYEQARAAYHDRLAAYNTSVQHWNKQRRIPRSVYENMEAEREQLDRMKANLAAEHDILQETASTLQSLEAQSQELVTAYNQKAHTYNVLYGAKTPFHKGEYNGNAITIYQFQNTVDLTLVIAHELGHALRIDHVDRPEAIMHAFMGAQDLDNLRLTPADIHAIRTLCGDET